MRCVTFEPVTRCIEALSAYPGLGPREVRAVWAAAAGEGPARMAAHMAASASGDAGLLRDGIPFSIRAAVATDVAAGLGRRHHQVKRHAADPESLRPVLVGPGNSYAAMDHVDRHTDATVIFVPGARAFLHNIDKYLTEILEVRRTFAAMPGPRTRFVAWAGHDAPGTDFLWTHDGAHVCRGGERLADFITALRMEEGEDHRIILDGFSLGASIVAMAALVLHRRGENPVSAVVMGGCPGVPYTDVAELGMPVERVFAHRSANDVCGCGALGHDPHVPGASTSLDIPIDGVRHVPPRAIPGATFDRYIEFLAELVGGGDASAFAGSHRPRSRIELGGAGFRALRRSRSRNLTLYSAYLAMPVTAEPVPDVVLPVAASAEAVPTAAVPAPAPVPAARVGLESVAT